MELSARRKKLERRSPLSTSQDPTYGILLGWRRRSLVENGGVRRA
jgi:hypothetical protein